MHASASWMGGVVYVQNLVKAISSLPPEERSKLKVFLIVTPETPETLYRDLISLLDGCYKADFLSKNISNKIRRRLAKSFPQIQKFLVSKSQISPIGGSIDFFYPVVGEREIIWDFPCSWAAWIPDFQHKHLPEFFPQVEIDRRDYLFEHMAHHSTHIVFSSQNALEDFQKFYPQASAIPLVLQFHTTIEESWLAIDPKTIIEKYDLPERFFLVSNQFWKHKNHQIIIEALHLLSKESIKPIIVCTGKLHDERHPELAEQLLHLVSKYHLSSQFYFLDLIPRIDQIQLMRYSLAVIQPSLFEGWSTVVEDARALDKYVILSDIPVHVEQNYYKSVFFSKSSSTDLAGKVQNILANTTPTYEIPFPEKTTNQRTLSQSYANQFLKLALEVCNYNSNLRTD
jgi:glycosyltransferase involved in cell wall biosynthesis